MLFFDDELRNKPDVAKIGVLMWLIDERTGMTNEELGEGLRAYGERGGD